MVSVTVKQKRPGTTRSLPRISHPAKLSNQTRRTLARQVTKNPMDAIRTSEVLCRDRRTWQKDKHLSTQTVWSYQTAFKGLLEHKDKYSVVWWHKIKLSGQTSKHRVWTTPGTAHHLLIPSLWWSMVVHLISRDGESGKSRGKDECNQIQRCPRRKPAPEL